MRNKLVGCLLAVLFVVNSSCEKDDETSNQVSLPKTLVTTFPGYPAGNSTTNFTYNGNKIVSVSNKFGKTEYIYNENHIVKKMQYDYTDGEVKYSETIYTYTGDRLETVTKLADGLETKWNYVYNEDGTVDKETYNEEGKNGDDSKSAQHETLLLVNGNISKSLYKSIHSYNKFTATSYSDYDTHKNPFKNILGFDLLLDEANFGSYFDSLDISELNISSFNNLKSYKRAQDSDSGIVYEPYAYFMNYEYNKNGYPVKKTISDYTEQVIKIITYTY